VQKFERLSNVVKDNQKKSTKKSILYDFLQIVFSTYHLKIPKKFKGTKERQHNFLRQFSLLFLKAGSLIGFKIVLNNLDKDDLDYLLNLAHSVNLLNINPGKLKVTIFKITCVILLFFLINFLRKSFEEDMFR